MPSRRIGTHVNLSPIQELSVNPFSNLDSDSINKLTRIVSGGKDGVVFGLDVKHSLDDQQQIESIVVTDPNFYNNSIIWTYDENIYPIYNLASINRNYISGFQFTNITDYCVKKVQLDIPINYLRCESFIGQNINCKFNFQFSINGNPRELRLYVEDTNETLSYPRSDSNQIFNVDVKYNFRSKQSGSNSIKLCLELILDPNDPYTTFKKDNTTFYHGQSDINITGLKITYSILNDRALVYNPSDSFNGDYPDVYVHPTKNLYITSGIAIKDDVVVDLKSISKNSSETIKLDLSSSSSWIKNNPYQRDEFLNKKSIQKAFIYNRRNTNKIIELSGTIDENDDLYFKQDSKNIIEAYDGIIINSEDSIAIRNGNEYNNQVYDEHYDDYPWLKPNNDKYYLSDDWDLLNSLELENISIALDTEKENITFEIPKSYLNLRIYIVNKETHTVIKEIVSNQKDNDAVISYNQSVFPLNLKNIDENDIKEKIGVYITDGPIKVSGYKNRCEQDMIKWAYVVLYYTYLKDPNPNKAYIGLIRSEDLNDLRFREDYVVLAKVRFVSPNTADIISYEDRQQITSEKNIANQIDYHSCIPYNSTINWINPNTGLLDIPNTVFDAIEKIASWYDYYIEKYHHIIESISLNKYNHFIPGEIVLYREATNEDNCRLKYDLFSSGYSINKNIDLENTLPEIPAWKNNTLTSSKYYLNANSELEDNLINIYTWKDRTLYKSKYSIQKDSEPSDNAENLPYWSGNTIKNSKYSIHFTNTSTENKKVIALWNGSTLDNSEYSINSDIIDSNEIRLPLWLDNNKTLGVSSYSLSGTLPSDDLKLSKPLAYWDGKTIKNLGIEILSDDNGINYGELALWNNNSLLKTHIKIDPRASSILDDGYYADLVNWNNSTFLRTKMQIRLSKNDDNPNYLVSATSNESVIRLINNKFKIVNNSNELEDLNDEEVGIPSVDYNNEKFIQKDQIDGQNGEVLYIDNNAKDIKINPHSILENNVQICDTVQELRKCLKRNITTSEFYHNTIPFGHATTSGKDYQYNVDSNYPSSQYFLASKNTKKLIDDKIIDLMDSQTGNSSDLYGLISKEKYNKIDITVEMCSSDGDDDPMGITLITKDSTGRQHNLTFSREISPAGLNSVEISTFIQHPLTYKLEKFKFIGFSKNNRFYDTYNYATSENNFIDDRNIPYTVSQESAYINFLNGCSKLYFAVNYTSYEPVNQFASTLDLQLSTKADIYHYITKRVENLHARTLSPITDSNILSSNARTIMSTCPVFNKALDGDEVNFIPDHNYVIYNPQTKTITDNNTYGSQVVQNDATTLRTGWSYFYDEDGSKGTAINLKYYTDENNHRIIESRTTPWKINGKIPKDANNQYLFSHDSIKIDLTDEKIYYYVDGELKEKDFPESIKSRMKLFEKDCHVGICSISQAKSNFKITHLETNDFADIILSRSDDRIYKYNEENKIWNIVGNKIFKDYLKEGTLYYNNITNKQYWSDLNKNIKLISDSTNQVELLNKMYPVGSIYIGMQTVCPFEGVFGKWVKISQGRCLFGADNNNTKLNQTIEAGLPNITGTIPSVDDVSGSSNLHNESGAFYRISANKAGGESVNNVIDNDVYKFDASRSNSIYGKSTTVQPPALVVNMWQRISEDSESDSEYITPEIINE